MVKLHWKALKITGLLCSHQPGLNVCDKKQTPIDDFESSVFLLMCLAVLLYGCLIVWLIGCLVVLLSTSVVIRLSICLVI